MADPVRIVAIVGTYRKGGVIDQMVDEVLASAREEGAEASKMFGMSCFKVKGKAFMGLFGDDAVFKLSGEPHRQELALRGARRIVAMSFCEPRS